MASAVIGALRANLSLNTAEFQKGIRAAKRSMGGLRDNMKRLGLSAGALTASLGYMGAASIQSAKDIARFASVAGTTPQTLQEWSAATKTVGIDQEKLADILKDVNDKAGDFLATGGGEMKDFFKEVAPKVGVTAQQFARLSGPEALQLYVDSLQKAGLGQKQMTFYMEAIANDATALLPLLRNNGAELKKLGQQARDSGALMSDSQIMALKDTGAAIERTKKAFVGMRNSVAASLAPTIEKLANAFTAAMQQGGALNRTFNFLANNVQRLATYVGTAAAAWGAYRGVMIASTIASYGFSRSLGYMRTMLIRTGLGALVVGLGEAVHQFMQLRAATGSAGEAFSQLVVLGKSTVNAIVQGVAWAGNRYIGVYRGAFQAIKEIWSDLPDVIGAAAIGAANVVLKRVEDMLNGVSRRINAFTKGINWALSYLPEWAVGEDGVSIGMVGKVDLPDIKNPMAEKALDAGRRAADAFSEGFGTDTFDAPKVFDVPGVKAVWKKIQDTISGASKRATEDVAGLNDELFKVGAPDTITHVEDAKDKTDELSEAAKNAKSAMSQLRGTMSSAFSSALTGAKSARDAVADLLRSLASMAANSAFQKLFQGMAGNGVGAGGNASFLGQAASWLFGGVGQNANGTDNWRGGLSWVGERGPELLNIPRGSQVYNAAESRRMAQGGGATKVELHLSPDLEARLMQSSGEQSVQIVQGALEAFSTDVLPARQAEIASDPMRRG